ncbi:hypothetical protein METBIDRAFT_99060 [Metschnikowia bicuspidata var. bicuspidata NRRL YB-4993]|uniref:Uncharacterized protein n=1 Tax=Metschnikowia bicuspidata var. bicuspidata NRRL YB-4993 TaxID=869754 RepID=A0A1A0HGI1_9ASCO|nr:hypothetical protein METBIDRAFT_99060 [Metschnikowia bicuspidata var. bicuspidata NRRL YB-4993]OBA23111.1 hypothetical protein METBIDRAFT_99060 [Metschnikowia bicuspidata var. bicuspidata NRRL YB-4993]
MSLRLTISCFENFSSLILYLSFSCLFLNLVSFFILSLPSSCLFLHPISYFILLPLSYLASFFLPPPLYLFPHLISCLFSASPGCLMYLQRSYRCLLASHSAALALFFFTLFTSPRQTAN